MGHQVDVAYGGADSPLYPEHIQCNLRAGGKIGGAAKAEKAKRRERKSTPDW
jgi:hypothetical protein